MALKLDCDRCHIQAGTNTRGVMPSNWAQVVINNAAGGTKDLCPGCAIKLAKFFKNEEHICEPPKNSGIDIG